jgi:hypothetical protein
LLSLRSIRLAHEAQVIPVMSSSIAAADVSGRAEGVVT